MSATPQRPSLRWVLSYIPVYAIHLLDERFYGEGTAQWATRQSAEFGLPVHFTNAAWLAVNLPSFLLLGCAAILVSRNKWAPWVALSLATHVFLHGFLRLLGTLTLGSVSPGVVTGVILCIPLAVYTWFVVRRTYPSVPVVTGVLVGVLSFQPLWHGVLLPFLPSPSLSAT